MHHEPTGSPDSRTPIDERDAVAHAVSNARMTGTLNLTWRVRTSATTRHNATHSSTRRTSPGATPDDDVDERASTQDEPSLSYVAQPTRHCVTRSLSASARRSLAACPAGGEWTPVLR